MTMHVHLSPEMENYIKGKVASGTYRNSTEVIRDAIRRMQAEENRGNAGGAVTPQEMDNLKAESFVHAGPNGG